MLIEEEEMSKVMTTVVLVVSILTSGCAIHRKSVELRDVRVKYPRTLTIFEKYTDGPIMLTNFKGKYIHGGLVPPGGLEVMLMVLGKPGSEKIVEGTESREKTIFRGPTQLSGRAATKEVYQYSIGPGNEFHQQVTLIDVEIGEIIYSFGMVANAEDRAFKKLEKIFDDFLGGVMFTK